MRLKRSKIFICIYALIEASLYLFGCSGKSDVAAGKAVVIGCDWGPAVSKVVVEAGQVELSESGAAQADQATSTFEANSDGMPALSKDAFTVRDVRKTGFFTKRSDREITDIYYSDEAGNKIDISANEDPKFITMELYYSPEIGSPFFYDDRDGFTKWMPQYSLEITANDEKALLQITADGNPIEENILLPESEKADTSGTFTGSEGNKMTYASFSPENASEENKRPLVIWLHGAGEGGTDPRITLYGNKVVALMGEEFQNTMDGAYVLVPQTAEFWKRNEEGDYFSNETGGDHSMYLNDLQELIDDFTKSNNVDPDRIIVGGASNGGFMALDLLIHFPEKYSRAYLICEIYEPELLSDDELKAIQNIPIWFVYAEDDMTVVPSQYEEPLIKRLKDIGNNDIHVSSFPDVHDTSGKYTLDGKPYQYYGHFSWFYFFNNECTEDGTSLWEWMAGGG